MPVYKDNKRGTWYMSCHYKDWQGEDKRKIKRGFLTKKEATDWEMSFRLIEATNLDMTFKEFIKVYESDIRPKLKENTWLTKNLIIKSKLIPFFGNAKMKNITPKMVAKWQNVMREYRDEDGNSYSHSYLKSCQSQLSAVFNHAVRIYNLKRNPVNVVGPIGGGEVKEVEFWTKEEYMMFIEAVADKMISFYAFEMLYWTGIRLGELLALTKGDFNFITGELRINKSYQKLKGRDVITPPKTPKSIRKIIMPDFLCKEMENYINHIYKCEDNDRIFCISKTYLHHEMDRGVKKSGVKRIKIHALRHSHISLLCNMGFSAVEIGKRVGHESIGITYRYAHMFPSVQTEMADRLNTERGDF
ncbi:site-specific integrase [uncultured Eubacterium sp.]|uniref:site-specific integrase n=1 Tax=uncultured Eubacterium sp. TaxID=165185 RepID=UPI0025945459|nr:site-specific integrase [uncultured Eubacterium sp.]